MARAAQHNASNSIAITLPRLDVVAKGSQHDNRVVDGHANQSHRTDDRHEAEGEIEQPKHRHAQPDREDTDHADEACQAERAEGKNQ